MVVDNLLLDYVGLTHVLDLAVHLVIFFGFVGRGDHPKTFLLSGLFYESTPSCLKVMGWVEEEVIHPEEEVIQLIRF